MMRDGHRVVVGQFGAPYGVRGWLKVCSFTEPLDNITNYTPWFVQKFGSNDLTIVTVEQHKAHGKGLIVLCKDLTTPEQAKTLTNLKIWVQRESFPPLNADEYYCSDLENLDVYNLKHLHLGKVSHVFSTGSNDVLVVQGKKNHLIPFILDQYIKSVDLEEQRLIVDWDENF